MSLFVGGLCYSRGMTERPSVYTYGNYRSFLQSMVRYLKERKEYSCRSFAAKAGLKAQSFIKLVIEGKRNLNADTAERVALALGLRKKEAEFFCQLVRFNQAKDLEEQNFYYQRLRRFARAELVQRRRVDTYELYSQWYHIPLYESFREEWQEVDVGGLARLLGLRDYQVHSSMGLLERLSLIEREGGRVRRRDAVIETPDEFSSLLVRNFHSEMGELAVRRLGELEQREREFRAVTFALSEESFEKLRVLLQEFSTQVGVDFSSDPSPKKLCQLNIQLFPLAELPQKN